MIIVRVVVVVVVLVVVVTIIMFHLCKWKHWQRYVLVYLPTNYHQQESCLRMVTLVHFPHQCLVHFPPPTESCHHTLSGFVGYLEVQICNSPFIQNKGLSYMLPSLIFLCIPRGGRWSSVSKHAFFTATLFLTKNLVIIKTLFFF